jgi:poly-gamma-glutamate synthesis protein (capsule biosynthesis protein)
MKILIAGDFFISDAISNSQLITKSVIELFNKADFRIVNLEAPITNNNSNNKINKTGTHLRMSEKTAIRYLNELNINCVTMANNHILDYGVKGINDTFDILNSNSISYVGAGRNLSDATKPFVFEQSGVKVALVNFCENEWAIAESNTSGANPMDLIENTNQIKEAKKLANFVIVIVHGGHEFYNLPSPRMQKQYRFYAEQGADIVIGHHTHCINGYEVYNGAPIFYSLGNFSFTRSKPIDDWYTGLVLELDFINGSIFHKFHPIRQLKETFKLSILDDKDKEKILERVNEFSQIIKDKNKLEVHWEEYIESQRIKYLNYWSPLSLIKNIYIRIIINKLGFHFTNKKTASLFLNMIRCESHRDLSKYVLEKYLKNENCNSRQ